MEDEGTLCRPLTLPSCCALTAMPREGTQEARAAVCGAGEALGGQDKGGESPNLVQPPQSTVLH